MNELASYFGYWGKAQPERNAQREPCHLLAFHCLDVAATGRFLVERHGSLAQRLANALDLDAETFRHLFVYSLALHDLGKFARSFQNLARPMASHLVPAHPGMEYRVKHDALGVRIWSEFLQTRWEWRLGEALVDDDAEDAINLWLGCFFGHHGKPVESGEFPTDAAFLPADLKAAECFVGDIKELLPVRWPLAQLDDEHWRKERLAPTSWQLAGLAILVDWLGSNAHYFPYRSAPISLEQYWEQHALPGAAAALRATGLLEKRTAVAFPGFSEAFGFAPTGLQRYAEQVPIAEESQLFVVEDLTGSGKTEAALTLAHRLLAEGGRKGLYFALPTMATSNAMYRRLGGYYQRLYSEDSRPSLVLAHGARHLSEVFRSSLLPEPNIDQEYDRGDTSAGIECRAWFADNRKKALLAEVGVGTIDQALLGVLPRKHQALRLLGLAEKVLLVDEIHAYDTYTSTLLKKLLEYHARAGGSVILLSATLPHSLRQDLVAAWQNGRNVAQATVSRSSSFPLVTHVRDQRLDELPVEPRATSRRDLPVRFIHDSKEAVGCVVEMARAGQCACWIRNTVDDAIVAYEQVREYIDDPGLVSLFHARFTMSDRQRIEEEVLMRFGESSGARERRGRVLIATQVVEQSLDLDFDVLVSDLAPIELLVQRAGRLHRHVRDASGDRLVASSADRRRRPLLRVLAPEWDDDPPADWVRQLLPRASYVYPDTAQLWRTYRILREEGAIRLPESARRLLEAVYGEDAPLPEGLEDAHWAKYAEQRSAVSGARFNALRLEQGYVLTGDGAGWDDDQEIGTRLSDERNLPVVLAREVEGKLLPWHEGRRDPWAMSTVNLREGLVRRLSEVPERLMNQVQVLKEERPILRWKKFWLPEAELRGAVYDWTTGLRIPHAGSDKSERTITGDTDEPH